MIHNDIIRSLRYTLDISDAEVAGIIRLSGHDISPEEVKRFLKKEGEEDYVECKAKIAGYFLDGLIIKNRGKRETGPDDGQVKKSAEHLTNNDILKKIRIAMNLMEDDILEIFSLAGYDISRGEITALFRKKGHKHYRDCGDQILRNFLRGLTLKIRKSEE